VDTGEELQDDSASLAVAGLGEPPARQRAGSRLVHFLQGSWKELQRVQWPDRRQVMQATGVVLGFVIVAGVFLGLADFVAQKLVNFILK
jgi:preprotein translocase subunit SecE